MLSPITGKTLKGQQTHGPCKVLHWLCLRKIRSTSDSGFFRIISKIELHDLSWTHSPGSPSGVEHSSTKIFANYLTLDCTKQTNYLPNEWTIANSKTRIEKLYEATPTTSFIFQSLIETDLRERSASRDSRWCFAPGEDSLIGNDSLIALSRLTNIQI